ncbi:MAG: copper resistance protein CopC [Acidobacteria bacterium]|nr:copper resistance protein CopC [Acidobacteriota bacterium]
MQFRLTRESTAPAAVRRALALAMAGALLAGPASAQMTLAGSTPEDGAALNGPVRTVRVWFDTAPPLENSTLELSGPGNRAKIEGLHTMGENDLMGRVTGPMPNGEWTMTWTVVGADGTKQTGTVAFTVQAPPR